MKTDETICLNSMVDGKQPSLTKRIYYGGGIMTAITTGWHQMILYEETDKRECGRDAPDADR